MARWWVAPTILYPSNRNKLTIKQPRKFVLNFAFRERLHSSPKIKSTKPGKVRSSSRTPRLSRRCCGRSFFRARLGVNFGVSLLLVRSGKLPPAGIAGKWFLSWDENDLWVSGGQNIGRRCSPVWVRMCVVRWSDLLNDLIHILHWKGFWPETQGWSVCARGGGAGANIRCPVVFCF